MSSTLYVKLLGEFSLAWPNRNGPGLVVGESHAVPQLWPFMAYLCVRRREHVEEAELVDALWGVVKPSEPTASVAALVQHAREVLEKLGFPNGGSVLLHRRGVLSWVPGLEFRLDTEELEQLYRDFITDPEGKLSETLAALPHYEGELLQGEPRQPWLTELGKRLRKLVLQIKRGAAEVLGRQKRYEEAIPLIRQAVAADPLNEWGQLTLMRLLHESGSTQSALWHYKSVARLYAERFGTEPPERLAAFNRELARASRTEEPDLQAIRKELEERDSLSRPLYCEYPMFQTAYHLTARSMPRTGGIAQLALLTLVERDGSPLSEARCNAAMDALRSDGLSGLREGDVCTRLTPNQYLLLLPSATPEDARMTLTRCLSAFEHTMIGQTVAVRTGVQPVEPIEI